MLPADELLTLSPIGRAQLRDDTGRKDCQSQYNIARQHQQPIAGRRR